MKKAVFAILILVGFIISNITCVLPVSAQPYQGSITISADGSVSPSTVPVRQAGDVYTLTSDVDGSIVVGRNNTVLDGNGYTAATVKLNRTSNDTVKNFNIKYNGNLEQSIGISLIASSNALIANNTVAGFENLQAIFVGGGSFIGIDIEGDSNVIAGNNVTYNLYGILIEGDHNQISGNTPTGDANLKSLAFEGLYFKYAANNTVYQNSLVNNYNYFSESSDNKLYHNNFVNSTIYYSVYSLSVNLWDDGYPSGGNYWSNYQSRYNNVTEVDSSRIGSTAYRIDSKNEDRYPLLEPFNITFFALQITPPEISIQSPTSKSYNEAGVMLNFSVEVISAVKTVNWTGYSLDGQQNVTITDNTTLTGLSSGLHNSTVYANDTYGNMGASENMEFTIPEAVPIVFVAAASAATAISIAAGIIVYRKKQLKKQQSP